jgi:hypothetical protein
MAAAGLQAPAREVESFAAPPRRCAGRPAPRTRSTAGIGSHQGVSTAPGRDELTRNAWTGRHRRGGALTAWPPAEAASTPYACML